MPSDNAVKIIIESNGDQVINVTKAISDSLQNLEKNTEKIAQNTRNHGRDILEAWKDVSEAVTNSLSLLKTAASTAKSIFDFARQQAEIAEFKHNFEAYFRSIGVSAENLTAQMKSATGGQVSEMKLMQAAMSAFKNGVVSNSKDMERLLKISETIGDQYGKDIIATFNEISTAIQSGNGKSLTSLGLLPEKFGKATNAADLLTKRADLLKAVLEQGQEVMDKVGDSVESIADKFNRFEASLTDIQEAAAKKFLPAMESAANFLNDAVIPSIQKTYEWYEKYLWILGRFEQKQREANVREEASLNERKVELEDKLAELRENSGSLRSQGTAMGAQAEIVMVEKQLAEVKATMAAIMFPRKRQKESNIFWENLSGAGENFLDAFISKKELEGLKERAGLAEKYWASYMKDAEKAAKDSRSSQHKAERESEREFEQIEKQRIQRLERTIEAWDKEKGKMGEIAIASFNLAGALNTGLTPAHEAFRKSIDAIVDPMKRAQDEIPKYAAKLRTLAVMDDARAKASQYGLAALSGASGFAEQKREGLMVGEAAAIEAQRKLEEEQESFRTKMRINVKSAFEEGLYDAMNGGDFFKSFGNALKAQVTNALAVGLTESIFGGGGSFNIGSLFSGSNSSGSKSFLSQGISAIFGGSSSGNKGSGFSLGNLFKGGSMLANVGTGLAVGFGINKLFGQGGLFGSRVVHGQESIQQSASINDQVDQAMEARAAMLGTVGMSASTSQKLRDIEFARTGYSWSKSGDGIFSKKTTTYAITNQAAAQASLDEYNRLAKLGEAEAAIRQLEKAMVEITDPTAALLMNMNDLSAAMYATSDATKKKELSVQIAQTKAAVTANMLSQSGEYMDFFLNNPYLAAGVGQPARGAGVYDYASTKGFNFRDMQMLTDFSGMLGVGGGGFGNESEKYDFFMRGINKQNQIGYDLAKEAFAAGSDPVKQKELLSKKIGIENEQLVYVQQLMAESAIQAHNMSLTASERAAAFERWQALDQKYWDLKLSALDNDQKMADLAKAKQSKLQEDILGTLLTHVGEVETRGNQKVIVISGGQSDGGDLARRLSDADVGLDPELAEAVKKIVTNISKQNGGKWA